MKISQNIINIRKNNNLTQDEFAEILGVTRQTVSNWENNKCYPDIETLIIISDNFNVSLDVLLKGDKNMVKNIDKNIKSNKVYKRIVILLSILLIVFIWIGYKSYLLNIYKNEYGSSILEKYMNNLEELNINYDNTLSNSNFEHLKLNIDDSLYEYSKGENSIHYKKDDEYYLSIFKYNTPYYSFDSNQEYYHNIDYDKLFKKYDIRNGKDLILYFKDNYKNKRNIFWSKSHIQMDFLSKYYVIKQVEYGKSIDYKNYYFNGSLNGILNETKDYFTIEVYYDTYTYLLSFNKGKYNFDDVCNILKTIYFE